MRTIAAEILCLCETKRNSIILKDYLAIITYSCASMSTILIALLLRHKFSIEHSSIAFDEFECVVCCVDTIVVSTKTKSRLISVCFNQFHRLCRNGRRSFMVPSMTMISSECANSQCQTAFDWFNWRFRCVRRFGHWPKRNTTQSKLNLFGQWLVRGEDSYRYPSRTRSCSWSCLMRIPTGDSVRRNTNTWA